MIFHGKRQKIFKKMQGLPWNLAQKNGAKE